jgi:transcriptional regulator with XRE-family HTH domain
MKLRAARERRGWTQEELEAASGVDQGVISRLELGKSSTPTIDTVRKLEAALKLRPGSLEFGAEERVSA